MGHYTRVFGFDIGFIDHMQVITTNNLQITMSFLAVSVFSKRFLVMTSNNGYSSAFGLKPFLNGGSLPTASLNSCARCPPCNISARTNRKHSSSAVAPVVFVGTCLFRGRYPVTGINAAIFVIISDK
jgi:hypothetical protein